MIGATRHDRCYSLFCNMSEIASESGKGMVNTAAVEKFLHGLCGQLIACTKGNAGRKLPPRILIDKI